jgi:hypothetical protein
MRDLVVMGDTGETRPQTDPAPEMVFETRHEGHIPLDREPSPLRDVRSQNIDGEPREWVEIYKIGSVAAVSYLEQDAYEAWRAIPRDSEMLTFASIRAAAQIMVDRLPRHKLAAVELAMQILMAAGEDRLCQQLRHTAADAYSNGSTDALATALSRCRSKNV